MIGQIKSKKLVCSAKSSTPSIIIKYWIIFDKSVCLGYIDGLMGGTGRGNALKQIGLSILGVILWLLFKWYWSKVSLFIKQLFKMFYLWKIICIWEYPKVEVLGWVLSIEGDINPGCLTGLDIMESAEPLSGLRQLQLHSRLLSLHSMGLRHPQIGVSDQWKDRAWVFWPIRGQRSVTLDQAVLSVNAVSVTPGVQRRTKKVKKILFSWQ